jgi:hypothetical protein
MSLLDRSNKDSVNSVYENFISKYRDKFAAERKGELDINYDGKKITISKMVEDISTYFYLSTFYEMREELNKKIIISSDADLNVVADRDALATKRIKLKADKNINILPHISNMDNSTLTTIYNIDVIANELCLSGRYTQLHNAFIKTDTLQVYNCPTMSFERIISGYINANSVEFKMYEFNDWNKTLKKLVTSSIKCAIEAFDVNKSQLELMKEIDPIQKLGLSEYNTNEFKFSFGKLEFILTRNANISHTYQLANGWYLIYC